MDELGRITLSRKGDNRTVVTDPTAGMFAVVKGDVLTDKDAHLAPPTTRTGSPDTSRSSTAQWRGAGLLRPAEQPKGPLRGAVRNS